MRSSARPASGNPSRPTMDWQPRCPPPAGAGRAPMPATHLHSLIDTTGCSHSGQTWGLAASGYAQLRVLVSQTIQNTTHRCAHPCSRSRTGDSPFGCTACRSVPQGRPSNSRISCRICWATDQPRCRPQQQRPQILVPCPMRARHSGMKRMVCEFVFPMSLVYRGIAVPSSTWPATGPASVETGAKRYSNRGSSLHLRLSARRPPLKA